MKLRKPISWILVLMLLLSMVPMQAAAAELTDAESVGSFYGIYLGSTQVTSDNCDDIFGDGTARYDPSNGYLYLNNPVIDGSHDGIAIHIMVGARIHVVGRYHMPQAVSTYGLYAYGAITLEGDFVFKGTQVGMYAEYIDLASGVICADGGVTGIEAEEDIYIYDNVSLAEFHGNRYAVMGGNDLDMDGGLTITTPENGYIEDLSRWEDYTICGPGGDIAKTAVLQNPSHLYAFDLYLGSVQVSTANREDILSDGSAQYEPFTGTLTLSDPTVTGAHENSRLYCGFGGLTVTGSCDLSTGILSENGLYINGDVTLSGSFALCGTLYGLYAAGDVHLLSCSLTASATAGGGVGVSCGGALSFENDTSRATFSTTNGVAVLASDILLSTLLQVTAPEGGEIAQNPDDPSRKTILDAEGVRAADAAVDRRNKVIDLEGYGIEEDPYLIQSVDDWHKLSNAVKRGLRTNGLYFLQTADFMIHDFHDTTGTIGNPFRGIYDGGGHTTEAFLASSRYDCVALFSYIGGATIKNLTVTGWVTGSDYTAGLVGWITDDGSLIQNCAVFAMIEPVSGPMQDQRYGGIIGKCGADSATVDGCVFGGSFYGIPLVPASAGTNNAQYPVNVGTIIGWSEIGTSPIVKNCLDISETSFPLGMGFDEGFFAQRINNYYTSVAKSLSFGAQYAWGGGGNYAGWWHAEVLQGNGFDLSLVEGPGVCYDGKVYAKDCQTVTAGLPDASVLYETDKNTYAQNGSLLTVKMDHRATVRVTNANDAAPYLDAASPAQGADNLFDGAAATVWSAADLPCSVTFRIEQSLVPKGYWLTTAANAALHPDRNPTGWTLEGSNDGESWALLTQEEDTHILEAKNGKTYAFSLKNDDEDFYSYYRFTVTDAGGSGGFSLGGFGLASIVSVYEEYDLWVDGTRANSRNYGDILGDGGKAKFDPATNTLTLDDPSLTGAVSSDDDENDYIFFAKDMDLTVKGRLSVSEAYGNYIFGVQNGGVTVDGDFTLSGEFLMAGAFAADSFVNIAGGTLRVRSINFPIKCVNGPVSFGDRVDLADLDHNGTTIAIFAPTIQISDQLIVTTPADGNLSNAGHVVLEHNPELPKISLVTLSADEFVQSGLFRGGEHLFFQSEAEGTAGDQVKLYLSFVEGYVPDTITVKGKDGTDVAHTMLTVNGTTVVSFTMPGQDVTVVVSSKEALIGDVNLDGMVDIRDVTAIQRHLADLEPLSGQALALADTNGDGEVNIADATHLQMYLAEYDVVLGKQLP